MNDYQKQANDFLEKTKTTFKAEFLRHGPHFVDDSTSRDIYKITLERNGKIYSFEFGQSIANSSIPASVPDYKVLKIRNALKQHNEWGNSVLAKKLRKGTPPTAYDVLACLQKYETGTHADFCADFGYDTDSRKGLDLYLRVQEEFSNVNKLFHDVLDELQEIN